MSNYLRTSERKQQRMKLKELRDEHKKHPPVWYTYHCYKPKSEKDRKDIEEMFKSMKLSYLYNVKEDEYKGLIMGKLGTPSKLVKKQETGEIIGRVYPTTKEDFELFKKYYGNQQGDIQKEQPKEEPSKQEN